jgi:hypothetical protein
MIHTTKVLTLLLSLRIQIHDLGTRMSQGIAIPTDMITRIPLTLLQPHHPRRLRHISRGIHTPVPHPRQHVVTRHSPLTRTIRLEHCLSVMMANLLHPASQVRRQDLPMDVVA